MNATRQSRVPVGTGTLSAMKQLLDECLDEKSIEKCKAKASAARNVISNLIENVDALDKAVPRVGPEKDDRYIVFKQLENVVIARFSAMSAVLWQMLHGQIDVSVSYSPVLGTYKVTSTTGTISFEALGEDLPDIYLKTTDGSLELRINGTNVIETTMDGKNTTNTQYDVMARIGNKNRG